MCAREKWIHELNKDLHLRHRFSGSRASTNRRLITREGDCNACCLMFIFHLPSLQEHHNLLPRYSIVIAMRMNDLINSPIESFTSTSFKNMQPY